MHFLLENHINRIINEFSADEWQVWLKCPYAMCQASVTPDMVERFGSELEKSKYDQFLLKSFVDNNQTMKWYPVRGSIFAIDLTPSSGDSSASYLSLVRFCWNCREVAHSPVDCKTSANWLLENAMNEHEESGMVYTIDTLRISRWDLMQRDTKIVMKIGRSMNC